MARRSPDLLAEKDIGWSNRNCCDEAGLAAGFRKGTCSGDRWTGSEAPAEAGVWVRGPTASRSVARGTAGRAAVRRPPRRTDRA